MTRYMWSLRTGRVSEYEQYDNGTVSYPSDLCENGKLASPEREWVTGYATHADAFEDRESWAEAKANGIPWDTWMAEEGRAR